jgi:magnesium transporter
MVDPIKLRDAVEEMRLLLESAELEQAVTYLRSLHPADAAEVISELDAESQGFLIERLEPQEVADIFEQMDEDDAVEFADHLDVDAFADVLDEMEPDMAADLLGEFEPEQASALLAQMEEADAIAPLLAYPEDTAGGIMNLPPPSLRRQMTVAEAYRFLRENYQDEAEMYYLYVLDRYGRLIGVVSLRALVLASPDQIVERIMDRDVVAVQIDTDQEEVAQLFARYDLLALPVVDLDHRLVGIVTIDDVVDVLEEEATEDIYRLAQISEGAEAFSPIRPAIRHRLPWLFVHLHTAMIGASVVALYEDTIAAVAVLAVFMPIVAGQGGNAGNQTMTIVVRSLALGEVSIGDGWRLLRHELPIGIFNGLVLGLWLGFIAWLWQGSPALGLVVAVALLANMVVAASIGSLIPIGLRRAGVDPALASSPLVTTTTDVAGFAVLLGLATYLLRFLG